MEEETKKCKPVEDSIPLTSSVSDDTNHNFSCLSSSATQRARLLEAVVAEPALALGALAAPAPAPADGERERERQRLRLRWAALARELDAAAAAPPGHARPARPPHHWKQVWRGMVRALLVRRARLESGDARALGPLTPAERRALDIEDERTRLRARYIQEAWSGSGSGSGSPAPSRPRRTAPPAEIFWTLPGGASGASAVVLEPPSEDRLLSRLCSTVPLALSGAGQGAGAGPDGTSLISVLCAPHRRFALVCRHWADTLELSLADMACAQGLEAVQQVLGEHLIGEVLFRAQLGQLTPRTHLAALGDAPSPSPAASASASASDLGP